MKVLCGDETGLLKLISVEEGGKVVAKWGCQGKGLGIESLCFGGDLEDPEASVAVGGGCGEGQYGIRRLNGWDTVGRRSEPGAPIGSTVVSDLVGKLRGMAIMGGRTVSCSEGGRLYIGSWDKGAHSTSAAAASTTVDMEIGSPISRMASVSGFVAVGGKENDLAVWDVATQKRTFKARNVPHDFLDMRVPVYVSSLAFMEPGAGAVGEASGHVLAAGTGLSQVRLYDTRAQRRPILDVELKGTRIMSIASTKDGSSVITADTKGLVVRLDVRAGLRRACTYKGFAGSVRSLSVHPSLPVFASAGLDRFVRVHNIETRELVCKVYAKQRLNCVLFSGEGQRLPRLSETYDSSAATFDRDDKGGSDDGDECEGGGDDPWDELEARAVIEDSEATTRHQKKKRRVE